MYTCTTQLFIKQEVYSFNKIEVWERERERERERDLSLGFKMKFIYAEF